MVFPQLDLKNNCKELIADINYLQVKVATANNISFMATGGGHGYTTTYQAMKDGISIQMSTFNSVSVNAGNNTMTIGGGVRFRDTFDPLYNAGKEIRKSFCSSVTIYH